MLRPMFHFAVIVAAVTCCIFIFPQSSYASSFKGAEYSNSTPISDDATMIKWLFGAIQPMEANGAYESDFYKELIDHQKAHNSKLEHQNEIASINAQIAKLESEKAKLSGKPTDKIDAKQLSLIQERAHLEIQDAAILSYYTQSEYDNITVKVSEQFAAQKGRIEARKIVYDQIQKLFAEAEEQMKLGSEIMASGYSLTDDLEHTYSNRTSFAHEANALIKMKRIQEIVSNLDMLLKYSNDELNAIISGNEEVKKETTEPTKLEAAPAALVEAKEPIEEAVVLSELHVSPAVTHTQEAALPIRNEEIKNETKKAVKTANSSNTCKVNEISDRVFFTVQLGAFQKPIDKSIFKAIGTVCTDNSNAGLHKYTSGQFESLHEAERVLSSAKDLGIADAFITAYAYGKRVTVSEASALLAQSAN